MPSRPDPFEFLARNGVVVQRSRTPPPSQPRSPESTPKPNDAIHGQSEPASPPSIPTTRPSGDLTHIALFSVDDPEGSGTDGWKEEVVTKLGQLGGRREVKGDFRVYAGAGISQPSRGCCVLIWNSDTDASHVPTTNDIEYLFFKSESGSPPTPKPKSKLRASPKSPTANDPDAPFKLITTYLRPAITSGELDDADTSSSSPPSIPFTAPITEVALATLKVYPGSPEASSKFESTIGQLIGAYAKSNAVEPSVVSGSGDARLDPGKTPMKGLVGAAWGNVREREDQYVFVFGWDCIEAHAAAVRSPFGNSTVMILQQLADLDIVLVELKTVETLL